MLDFGLLVTIVFVLSEIICKNDDGSVSRDYLINAVMLLFFPSHLVHNNNTTTTALFDVVFYGRRQQ